MVSALALVAGLGGSQGTAFAQSAGGASAMAADQGDDWGLGWKVNAGGGGTGTDKNWGWVMVGGPAAKASGFTGNGVVVGVVDTGIDFSHPALAGRTFGYEYGAYVPGDNSEHATHVAGIIGAADIGEGMQGVAPQVTFSSLQIFTGAAGNFIGEDKVAQAYDGAVTAGVRIFNNSWGATNTQVTEYTANQILAAYPTLVPALQRAVAADSVLVWSTGNDGNAQPNIQPGLPYRFPELKSNWLAVTSVGRTGELAYYANACGVAKEWCLAAPGGDSSVDPGIYSTLPGNTYGYLQGTSMAAPYVTGAVAIAREMFPNATGAALAQLVLQTSRDIGAPGIDNTYGWGLLAVDNLVNTIDPRGAAVFASSAWGRFATQAQIGNTVLDRLASLRAGRNDSTAGFQGFAGPALALDKGIAFSASAKDPARPAGGWAPAVWAQGLFGTASLAASPIASGATVDISGGLAGVDLISTRNLLLGVAAGATSTSLTAHTTADRANADAGHVLGYGAVQYGPGFVNLTGGWSRFDQSIDRRYFPGTTGTVFASTNPVGLSSSTDDAYFIQGRAGWAVLREAGRFEPYIHAAARNQSMGAFAETNASIFGLSASSASLSENEFGAGVRWSGMPIAFARGQFAVAPAVDLAYVHFDDGTLRANTDLLGTPVVGETASLGANGLRFGASVAVTDPKGSIDGFVGYTGTYRDNATSHAFSGGLSVRF